MTGPILLMARALGQGGSERQLAEMAVALSKRGWQVHVACFEEGGMRARDLAQAQIPVLSLGIRSFRSLSFLAALRRLAQYRRKHGIRFLHAFDYPSNFVAALAGHWCGFSRIITSQRSFRELRSASWRRVLRWTDRRADAIVVNCEALRGHMIVEEGAPAAKVHVCHNGLDAARFPMRTAGNGQVMGVVCALRPEKGLPVLLRAFAEVARTRPQAHLLVVGSGPEHESLRRLATEFGIDRQCEWQPATADVAPWLQRMDIFVLPSESEAFSNSLLEAMASRCAVVASAVGGNIEMLDQGHFGMLFPRGDAPALAQQLARLLDHPAERERLAGMAAARVRELYSIDRAADTFERLYRAVEERLVR